MNCLCGLLACLCTIVYSAIIYTIVRSVKRFEGEFYMNFGESLKKIRAEKGFSIKKVSDDLKIPYRTYQSYELNDRTLSLENARKVALYYGVSIERLFFNDK
jgi:predicted transcriptional regulator